jgi:hypothetical protein
MPKKGFSSMSKMWLIAVVSSFFAFWTAPLGAQPPDQGRAEEVALEVLLDTVRANRKAFVAVNLELTDEEAVQFWPIYDRYQKEVSENGDRLVALIRDYTENFSDLSNEKALKIVEDYLTIERDRVELRFSYMDDFTAILPGRKVARLYQIENKVDALIRYDLAANIPVIEDKITPSSR